MGSREVQPPKGMRDFPPELQILRKEVFARIEKVFQRYGFDPIETPIVERWEVLSGKYGEEAERKLIWRFKLPYSDREFGLRYDLTVPLARFVARFRPSFPFKRYHIGRVYRYEEPQRGRYREFWQCDIDIVGTESPLADAEILNVVIDVFEEFGFTNYVLRVNDRRLLKGVFKNALEINSEETLLKVLRTIDKMDRIGKSGVLSQLKGLGLDERRLSAVDEILSTNEYKDNEEVLEFLRRYEGIKEVGEAVNVLNEVLGFVKKPERVKLDLSMVRGLDYYTGMIYEAVVTEPRIGSLSGGGRYDDLIGMFIGQRVPAVGGSIGVERLVEAGMELGLFKTGRRTYANIGIVYLQGVPVKKVLEVADALRSSGKNVYVPYEPCKSVVKGIKDLEKRGIRYAVIIGRREYEAGVYTLQDLESRERRSLSLEDLVKAQLE